MDTFGPDRSLEIDEGFDYFASLMFNRPVFDVKAFSGRAQMSFRLEVAREHFVGLAVEDLDDGRERLCLFARSNLEAARNAYGVLRQGTEFKFDVAIRPTGRILFAQRERPAMGGDSIGHSRGASGTFGCTVTDGQGRTLILSCNHVLADLNRARRGDDILQPGIQHGGRASDRIGELTNYVPLAIDGQTANTVDAAVAVVDHPAEVNAGVRAIGPLAGTQPPPPPKRAAVFKQGVATGWTSGRVVFRKAEVPFTHAGTGTDVIMADQYGIIGTAGRFSDQGDSGAVVIDEQSQVVAMVIGVAEEEDANVTFATPIGTVLHALQVNLP